MKRYFHTTTKPGSTAFHCDSEWNYLNLPDGSYLLVMFDEHCAPDPTWTELPHLLETTTVPANVATAVGSLVALVPTDQTFNLAKKLAVHNPRFHP